MDINTWLTIVTIFLGIITFLSKEERTLLQLKFHKAEYISFFILLIVVIPFLIEFPIIANRWQFFWMFTIKNGFDSNNIAFAIFYGLFIWIIIRYLFIRPIGRVNNQIIAFFKNSLNEVPFPQFFSLFSKYSPVRLQNRNWILYKEIVLQPEFLKGISQYRPSYVNNIWGLLESDEEFKLVFGQFLSNPNSVYYNEIKSNEGITTVLGDLPFLQSTTVMHLIKNRENGLLYMISDFSKQQIRSERGKTASIYLQPHHYVHTKGEEGYDLPVYYHIRFLSLMYSTAITNKIDTYPHMHTIYQGIIEEMINNLRSEDREKAGEYPTNYHWLIGEIFSAMNTWLEYFGEDHPLSEYDNGIAKFEHIYFDVHSSYVDFIPSCMNFSCKALYEGLDQGKLQIEFVARLMHYNIFNEYFSHRLKDEMRVSIEENIIKHMPKKYVADIFDLSLDEAYANHFYSFIEKHFSGSSTEQRLQLRLWDSLKRYNLL